MKFLAIVLLSLTSILFSQVDSSKSVYNDADSSGTGYNDDDSTYVYSDTTFTDDFGYEESS
jgi:hypothetical protein